MIPIYPLYISTFNFFKVYSIIKNKFSKNNNTKKIKTKQKKIQLIMKYLK